MTPTRGIQLFRAISKKLGRKSQESISSSDSSSCSSHISRKMDRNSSSLDSGFKSLSCKHISTSSSNDISDTESDHHQSISTENIKNAFRSLLKVRSQSCSSGSRETKRKSKKPVKKILRSPVTYTYVKGMSGLPTQRIPRHHQARQKT